MEHRVIKIQFISLRGGHRCSQCPFSNHSRIMGIEIEIGKESPINNCLSFLLDNRTQRAVQHYYECHKQDHNEMI